MKTLMTAIVVAIAIPAVANAQAAPAMPPKAEQSGKMMDCKCCKDMAGTKGGAGAHAGHDMSQSGAKAPQADTHQNHKQ